MEHGRTEHGRMEKAGGKYLNIPGNDVSIYFIIF